MSGGPLDVGAVREPDKHEKVWAEFWEPLLVKEGELNLDQVKRELHDYSIALDEVPKVYDEITNGRMTKPFYAASEVLTVAEDWLNERRDEEVEGLEAALEAAEGREQRLWALLQRYRGELVLGGGEDERMHAAYSGFCRAFGREGS